jgi:FtsP/CotA-like multicopper oxidase with cupredoxin domain
MPQPLSLPKDHAMNPNLDLTSDRLPAAGGMSRRNVLRWTGAAAAGLIAGGLESVAGVNVHSAAAVTGPEYRRRLIATDGCITLPGRAAPLLIFGFREVSTTASVATLVSSFKGKAQFPGPIFLPNTGDNVYLTLTNIGFKARPDLADSHTIHWHGLPNAISYFDGTPEMSVSAPPRRDMPYYYKPKAAGTYMYHCHFEDVEHVQMGMTGIIAVRPAGQLSSAYPGVGAFDRQFSLLLGEIDTRPHDLLAAVQEFTWVNYKPNYWVINGRSYPNTVKPAAPGTSQPISSLVQVNGANRVLLRFANLGYEQHSMHAPGLPLLVVGEDARPLRTAYPTNVVYIGPGEARDVTFTAPAFNPALPVAGQGTARGPFNTYLLKNRNYRALTNNGTPGLGGMATEVRVYRNALPVQTSPNQTF